MMLFLLLTIFLIYIQSGLTQAILFGISLILYLLTNFLLIINPISRELHIIRLLSLITAISIFYLNSTTILASIIPSF